MLYSNILDDHQRELVGKLKLDAPVSFYLAGGTALALQIGHRTSVDFDFYSYAEFNSLELIAQLNKTISDLTVRTQTEKTLRVFSGTTEISFFGYPYPLIRPTVAFESLKLASKEDIAAMKLIAIVQRGTQRDFIDVYFLLQEFTLLDIFGFVQEKFRGYPEPLLLKALVFFEDAESGEPREGVRVLEPGYSWEAVKGFLSSEVKKYQMKALGRR